MLKLILRYIKTHKMKFGLIAFFVLILGIISFRALTQNTGDMIDTKRVPKVTLIDVANYQQENVSIGAIGEVESLSQVELKSQISERVQRIHVSIGDRIARGQILVTLNSAQLQAQFEQAKANLEAEEAGLQELKKGIRAEELRLQEVKVENAKIALEEAKTTFINSAQDAYTKSDDAIRNKADQLFVDPRSSNPRVNFLINNIQLENDLKWERFLLETTLKEWNNLVDQLHSQGDFTLYSITTKENLARVSSLLEKLGLAINQAKPNLSLTQTTINVWKADISVARSSVNTTITSFSAADEKLKTAKANLSFTENELLLKQAGATSEQITSQEARVKSMKASVQNFQAQLAKTTIRAPITGIIATIPIRPGELVNPGEFVVSIVNPTSLQLKAYINSRDIKLVREGAKAVLENEIEGIVTKVAPSIDPKTKKVEVNIVVIEGQNPDLVIGQLANAAIFIDEELQKENLFLLPLQAIKVTTEQAFVYTVNEENKIEQHPLVLGRVIGELIEIKEGLDKDMHIVFSIRGLKVGQTVQIQ